MAVKLVGTMRRFIGLSTDGKSTDCENASTFLETDTGNMYIFDLGEKVWSLKEEVNVALRLEVLKRFDNLLEEAKKTNENLMLVIEALNG